MQTFSDHPRHPSDDETLFTPSRNSLASSFHAIPSTPLTPSAKRRAFFVRSLALLCACCLSIGSHYATNILGPLKSRLSREMGTSNTDFGLLLAAFSLNSTWTPLVGGLLASTLGTTMTSILATSVIFLGVSLLLLGDIWENVRVMVLGLFVFGLGVSPLAVVQETIIVRFFKSHGLGVSMAFGLIAGKGASFVSARTSYPLSERFGKHAPFYVATFLTGLSVVVNLIYIASSKWMIDGAGAELEATDISEEARRRQPHNLSEAQALERVAAKRRVNLRSIAKLGDIFWAYVGLNLLCGMIWSPFTHLAANIIESRYNLSEESAANEASYLLAGSIILYPVCGFIVDRFKHRPIIVQLLMLSSVLTMLAYTWLAAPSSWTRTPAPTILTWAVGQGYAPLMLVVLVPTIVPSKYVSTALGLHKSLEQTGSTLFQTLAGLALDSKHTDEESRGIAVQHVLNVFLLLNVLQLCSICVLARLQQRKNSVLLEAVQPRSESLRLSRSTPRSSVRGAFKPSGQGNDIPDSAQPLLDHDSEDSQYSSTSSYTPRLRNKDGVARKEARRGKVFATLCAALVVLAWVLFMTTAYFKL